MSLLFAKFNRRIVGFVWQRLRTRRFVEPRLDQGIHLVLDEKKTRIRIGFVKYVPFYCISTIKRHSMVCMLIADSRKLYKKS